MSIHLLLLPFAGGSQYSYQLLKNSCPQEIKITAVDLPGRGARIDEKLLFSCDDMVKDLMEQLEFSFHGNYAIFGHSMGALLGYLLVKEIIKRKVKKPICLFVSGREAPNVIDEDELYYLLPKKEFLEKIRKLDGIPKEVYEDKAIMDFFEPILRADLTASETYKYQQTEVFDIPIHILKGTKELYSIEDSLAWKAETTGEATFSEIEGGHFFLFEQPIKTMNIIANKLKAF